METFSVSATPASSDFATNQKVIPIVLIAKNIPASLSTNLDNLTLMELPNSTPSTLLSNNANKPTFERFVLKNTKQAYLS